MTAIHTSPAAFTHLPPHSAELEAAVLGVALMEAQALATVQLLLPTAEAFYVPRHRLIYSAMLELSRTGGAVDLLTVVQQLTGRGTLQKAGGAAFIAGLMQSVGSSAHIETHCRLVQQQHARRVIIAAGQHLQAHGQDEGRDPLDLVSQAQQDMIQLQQSLQSGRGAVSAASLLPEVLDGIRRAISQKGMTGIPTGLTELNTATGGWQKGELIIFGARPGMGKTAALLHHAREAALQEGQPTAIFSMEMPAQQLVRRLLATELNSYSNSDLRRGKLAGGVEEVDEMARKAHRLASAHNLLIDDTPALTLQQLEARATRLVAEHGVGLILIDYLQLMSGPAGKSGNRESEINSISRGLKALAKTLNVPIIALAQLSRSVEQRGGEKRPQLSDLRDSGAIEQDADMVIFLWRGEYYSIEEYADGTATKDTILYDIAKSRDGSTGELVFDCRIERGVFADLNASPVPAGERPFYVGNGQSVALGKLPDSTDFARSGDYDSSTREPDF